MNTIGISRVISTSKIKKITAIKKNCKEKGNRAEDLGSNPHSKGEFFSRSEWVFLEIKFASIITTLTINKIIIEMIKVIIIIYTNFY